MTSPTMAVKGTFDVKECTGTLALDLALKEHNLAVNFIGQLTMNVPEMFNKTISETITMNVKQSLHADLSKDHRAPYRASVSAHSTGMVMVMATSDWNYS